MSTANCVVQRIPVEVFFPEGDSITHAGYRAKIEYAKSICEGCPVALQCLQAALAENEYGVWGGTTREERDAMRKGTRRKPLNVMRNPNRK